MTRRHALRRRLLWASVLLGLLLLLAAASALEAGLRAGDAARARLGRRRDRPTVARPTAARAPAAF